MSSTMLPRPFGRYTLIRRLATGGMAEVYLATARGLGGFEKRVAIKRVHPHFATRRGSVTSLIDEAKLSVHLVHPNIVQTFDFGRDEGTDFIVMEHVEGYDAQHVLDALRENGRFLPIEVAAHVMSSVCRALDYAHRCQAPDGVPAGIVHRDVSPQNILISLAGEVKLGDFGIAKTNARESNPDGRVIKGKYFYMSPEQARAEPLDHRSDVFSAGIVLWELLVGRRLYEAYDLKALIEAVRRAEVPAPSSIRPEVQPALDAIVARATARSRERRFEDAGAMADALEGYLSARRPVSVQTAIAELLAEVPDPDAASMPSPLPHVPITREQLATPLADRATPTEPTLRYSLDDGVPTLAGWQSPGVRGSHGLRGWAFLLGTAFVGLAAWLLFSA